jgi:protein O-mannosyl-transferase
VRLEQQTIINKKNLVLFFAVSFILVATVIAYYPCSKSGFVWDDEGYILKNYYIKNMTFDNVKAIMTTPIMGNYHPLVIISYAWEYFFFKLNPAPYHIINLVIHLLNCILVFYFILRLSGNIPVAFITGLLFGIHPLHVESVAWISERKDVLYAFFYLISLICYLSYLNRRPAYRYYVYSLFFFLLSILSKPMAITLPLILFLMDYFHNRKFDYTSIVEKIPFITLSILSGIVTLFAQRLSQHSDPAFAFPASILVASHGLVFYLFKMILPTKLAALYRYPLDNNLFLHIEYLIAPVILFICALLIFYSAKYSKKAIWGGLFYCITLLPVIQLLPIGLAVASDRYTYVPLIGIFYVLSEFFVWTWWKILKNRVYLKAVAIAFSLAVVVLLVFLTQGFCKVWKDNISLWSNVAKHYPQTDVAYNNRGSEYFNLKEYEKALRDFLTAIEINRQYGDAYINICNVYFVKNEHEKAIPYCMTALKISPAQPNTYAILGDIYWSRDKALSIEMYKKSVSLSSYHFIGHTRLCNAYILLGKFDDAYPVCFEVTKYNPDDPAFCNNMGNLYLNAKQYNRALSFYLQALSIDPNLSEVHNNLAVLYYYLNDHASAIKHFNVAVALGYKVDPEFQKLVKKHQKEINGFKK